MAPKLTPLGQEVTGRYAEYRYQLSKADQDIELRVVRRRRKTMAIYVEKDTETELRVPLNCPWRDIEDFLSGRFDWIIKARADVEARPTAPQNQYRAGGMIRYLGAEMHLTISRSQYSTIQPEGDTIYLSCRQPNSTAQIERQILEWYRRQSEERLPQRVSALNQLFLDKINPGAITVRKMKSRWGSCSNQGDLCFNLLLIQEPPSQIDFVVAHELCHLRHFAHNGAFYGLLDKVMPDWRDREEKLGMAG